MQLTREQWLSFLCASPRKLICTVKKLRFKYVLLNLGNLSIKAKTPCPNVSFIQRFHCTYKVSPKLRLTSLVKAKFDDGSSVYEIDAPPTNKNLRPSQ